MKKFLIISLIASLLSAYNAKADTASATIISGTMTNIFTGYGKINSIVLTGTTSTNASGFLVDSITNSTVFITSAYSNIVSYITNVVTLPQYYYTNYYGVVTTLTNSTTTGNQVAGTAYALVDMTNSVPANTNNYPSVALAVAGNATVLVNPANINIIRGAWFTNSGSGTLTVTLSYTRQ